MIDEIAPKIALELIEELKIFSPSINKSGFAYVSFNLNDAKKAATKAEAKKAGN